MAEIGTPLSSSATKVLFCGAGELGKEVMPMLLACRWPIAVT